MELAGLQKTTLLDYPGKVACTVFLPGCNLRCPFCHNASLVLAPGAGQVSLEAFFAFLAKRQGILDGVCVTGGEPTLYPDLPDFLGRIRAMGFCVKLDTNGTHPEALKQVLSQGLADYVAMDIKAGPARYADACGGMEVLNAVRKSAGMLMGSGVDYEFRTTCVHPIHTPEDMAELGAWLQGAKRYFLQAFVDSGDLVGRGMSALTPEEMQALLQVARRYIPNTQLRGL